MLRFRKFFPLVLSIAVLLVLSAPILAQDTPAYLNPDLPVEERVADLLARMSLEEKIGQMTQIEKNSLTPADVTEWFIGSVLSGGGGYPFPNTPEAWAAMVNSFQEAALATPLAIPMIYGVDAVHGHNNVEGAVIFPQKRGAWRNPQR
ncbi:MAG: glycoside hydrolase family protein [Chloroflexi bacterium OLB15]|nr:MAG: glycoside hydrolase family protein [Chloroflexi bacterium OLB15]